MQHLLVSLVRSRLFNRNSKLKKCYMSLCFHTGISGVDQSAPANAVEDAAAVSAISKQQILVQYLKVSFDVCFIPIFWSYVVSEWSCYYEYCIEFIG